MFESHDAISDRLYSSSCPYLSLDPEHEQEQIYYIHTFTNKTHETRTIGALRYISVITRINLSLTKKPHIVLRKLKVYKLTLEFSTKDQEKFKYVEEDDKIHKIFKVRFRVNKFIRIITPEFILVLFIDLLLAVIVKEINFFGQDLRKSQKEKSKRVKLVVTS